MLGEGWAIGALTPETGGPMHRLGGMVLGTIEGHPQGVRKDPPDGQGAVLCQTLQALQGYPIERTRAQRIKEVASLRVPGELLHTEQGRGILGALGWLAMALGLQKRRRWGEKEAPFKFQLTVLRKPLVVVGW